jgi:TPR repeat protein
MLVLRLPEPTTQPPCGFIVRWLTKETATPSSASVPCTRKGRGVAQDDVEAAKWYRLAANQGHAQAQFNRGVAYDNGRGVVQDEVLAHLWFNLSVAQGNQEAAKNRDIVARRMTPAQLAQAQKLAREWKPE